MIRRVILGLAAPVLALLAVPDPAEAFRLGGGVHYLRTVGDIKDDEGFDENATGILGSVMLPLPAVRLEGIVEWIPDWGGGSSMVQPQAWALLGAFLYGGVGVGIGWTDDRWQDRPFWALRVGLNLELGGLNLDGFGSYRLQSTDEIEGVGRRDLDTVTLGAILRFD